jgi:hypothetical protein
METKNFSDDSQVSKAQLEVWEWKEKAYEEMKHLSTGEQINFIHEETKELVERIRKKKQLRQAD